MARKDVDLVIRARDEAAKVVNSITAAINEFVGAQADLDKSASKTSSTLGALGNALGGLDKELRGLSVSDKIAREFDRATEAAKRLNDEFQETKKVSEDLARQLRQAESATERLSQKNRGAAQAQQQATALLERQKNSQRELTAALAKATQEREKLARQEARQAETIAKQNARVEEAGQKYNRLAAEMARVENPTKTLQNRVEAANNSLQKQTQRLTELQQRYAATQGAIQTAGQRIAELGGRLESANTAVARQETTVAKINNNYRNLQAAAKTAARNQSEIATAADKTADALGRQSQRIERAQTELQQLGIAAGRADAAMAELAAASGTKLQQAFDRQRRAMLETKREWVESTQAATRLAQEMGRVGVPTREMAEAFARNRTEASRTKQEYIAQRDGLHQLSAVLKQSGTDLETLRAKQAQFAQVQGQTGAAIARIRQEAAQSASSYNVLSGNATRAATSVRAVGQAANTVAGGTSNAARSTNSLADAYRRLYGESRQAMSWTQRLRGEVLALVTSYAGLYGAINILRQTITAYQTLEAVQNRLNAAFQGDVGQAAADFDWLRRNADRLGVTLATLGDEYSKFAVAAKAANFENQAIRDTFLSVAEAARVNKLSTEQMSGVFLALQQMISKGKVQSEELRRQLGDRLPGAFNIMAEALGVTTAELDKMMQAGEVIADQSTLIKFAAELDRRFGGTLAASLETTTTALGRFQNATFQALVQFGNAGFIESFTRLLNNLTQTLKSADFQTFAGRVSRAFSILTDAVGLAVKNFNLLVVAGSAFAGIKLTPLLVAMAANFLTFAGRVQRAGTALVATRNTMRTVAATTTGVATATGIATTAIRGLTLAVRALISSTGIGMAVTAISVAIGYWATRADSATEALNAHQKVVDRLKNAYDEAGGSAEKWAQEVAKVSQTQAIDQLQKAMQELADIRNEARAPVDTFGVDTKGTVLQLEVLINTFKMGNVAAEDFKAEIDRIAREDPKLDRNIAIQLLEIADRAVDAETKVGQFRAVLDLIEDPANDAARAVLGIGEATASAADEQNKARAAGERFKTALEGIAEAVERVNSGFDLMAGKEKLDEAFSAAAKAASTMGELNRAIDEYNKNLDKMYKDYAKMNFGSFTSGVEASASFLRDREGFRATPYWDVNAYRVGFGSDTITLADGSIQKVVQGMRVSVEDANRDLVRRIGEFQNVIRGQIGEGRFNAFTPQQQAALTSVAYNYGSLPERILGAVRTGTNEEIAAAIRSLGGDNKGINRERRNLEAGLFGAEDVEALSRAQQQEDKRREQEITRQREATQETIEANQQALEQQRLINDGKAREAEIEKAIADARKANPNITAEEIAKIREQAGALFDLKNVQKENKQELEQARQAMQQVNALLQQRTALEQQLNLARKQSDSEKVQETEEAIQRVNTELETAIANAREMWRAIGGPEADNAILKLDTAAVKAANLAARGQQNYFDWQRVGRLFASGLTNAFDRFAQSVSEGKSVGEAARDAFLQFAADFLRQIAQMIIQQAILNALRGIFPTFSGATVGLGHTGGLVGASRVGSGNSTRQVDPGIFAGAMRYHEGGIAGIRPGEVPIIAKRGEEILTQDDPRHILNGAMAGSRGPVAPPEVRIINTIDSGEFVSNGMKTSMGQKAIINFIRENSESIRAQLGV